MVRFLRVYRERGTLLHFPFVVPLVLFLTLSAEGLLRGRPGEWHEECREFWNAQNFGELIALAENLIQLEEHDAETLFFGMMASYQLRNNEKAESLARELLKRKALNRQMENGINQVYRGNSLVDRIQTMRTLLTMMFFLLLIVLFLLSFWLRKPLLPWISLISSFGSAVLLI